MTTTDPGGVPTLTRTPAGTFLLIAGDDALELTWAELEHVTAATRDSYYAAAPQLLRVLGREDADGGMIVTPPEEASVYAADGYDLTHGLACPHPDCDHVAWADYENDVTIVDCDERWSSSGYHRDLVPEQERYLKTLDTAHGPREVWDYRPTGRQVMAETLYTGGADSQYDGLGYRCAGCGQAVTLPDGVEEQWA